MLFKISLFFFALSSFVLFYFFVISFLRLSQIERERKSLILSAKNFFKEKISEKFKKEVLLEKFLRRLRILNLKLDFKISNYLQELSQRKKERQKSFDFFTKIKEELQKKRKRLPR